MLHYILMKPHTDYIFNDMEKKSWTLSDMEFDSCLIKTTLAYYVSKPRKQ